MKLMAVVSVLVVAIIIPNGVRAELIASDRVTLYQYGKRITDTSVFWQASYGTYFEVCINGVCDIGQQFYPVTFYKTKIKEVPQFTRDYIDRHPSYSRRQYEEDINNLMRSAVYSVEFDLGQTEGGESANCGLGFFCTGGTSGAPRDLKFDLKFGRYIAVSGGLYIALSLVVFGFLVLAGSIYFKKHNQRRAG